MSHEENKDPVRDRTTDAPFEENDNFLSRWSRRKAMAREGIEPPEPEPDRAAIPPAAATKETRLAGADVPETIAEERTDGEGDTPAEEPVELPPIESLDEHSDYSAFLRPDVGEDLQRQALRKLFHSPKFNLRDGLDDYDLDYSNPEPLGSIVTAEMRHRLLREIERLTGPGEDAAEDGKLAATDQPAEQPAHDEPDEDDDRSEPA